MCYMIVKQLDMVLKEEAVGQLCTKFHESRWYICLAMDETYVIFGRYLHENDPIY